MKNGKNKHLTMKNIPQNKPNIFCSQPSLIPHRVFVIRMMMIKIKLKIIIIIIIIIIITIITIIIIIIIKCFV